MTAHEEEIKRLIKEVAMLRQVAGHASPSVVQPVEMTSGPAPFAQTVPRLVQPVQMVQASGSAQQTVPQMVRQVQMPLVYYN